MQQAHGRLVCSWWWAGLLVLAACGSPAGKAPPQADALADAPELDAAQTDASLPDLGLGDLELQCPGNAGCSCDSNTDCGSGLCVETAEGNRCAVLCSGTCPAGFVCRSTSSAGDPVSYCAPMGVRQCAPCQTNADCNAALSVQAECVSAGNAGSFCASTCQTSADCPADTTCQTNPASGKAICAPPAGLASCACSAWAKAALATTSCSVIEGADACPGTRACGPAGLEECSKLPGAVCVDAGCKDAKDGSPCDDGDPCTQSACGAGVCAVTKDSCQCKTHNDCASAEDGDLCNGTLVCDTSALPYTCKVDPATQISCPASDQACQTAVCLPATGSCTTAPAADQTACDDGNPCTTDTICKSGVCGEGLNICECQTTADCKDKNDADLCNGSLYCDPASNTCKVNPASIMKCPASNNVCADNLCQPETGTCLLTAKADNTACSDGDACTEGDYCKAGSCQKGTTTCCKEDSDCVGEEDGNQCNGTLFCNKASGKCQVNPKTVVKCPKGLDSECQQNVCEPTTGACVLAQATTETLCDDGNSCSGGDHCDGQGGCVSNTQLCPCVQDADCSTKEDGNLCNGTLYCDLTTNTCALNPATVVTCPFSGDKPCAPIECQPATGECQPSPVLAGSCDDDDPCTAPGTCSNGQCVAGPNLCQCQTAQDCGKFDDANPCNGTLYCDTNAGMCKNNLAAVPVCPPGADGCTVNACDPQTGSCKQTAAKDGAWCSDGEPCTKSDACQQGLCQPGVLVCACLKDSDCAAYDDGNPCTGTWFCSKDGAAPECAFNPASVVQCDTSGDGACLQTGCNPANGNCEGVPKAGPCDDGNACSVGDVCGEGACLPGAATVCDDGNPCTTDSCAEAAGCQFVNNTVGCDDGNSCTTADVCDGGSCSGAAVSCNDNNPCTTDGCSGGSCQFVNNTAGCDDGDACTTADVCGGGSCAGTAISCDDGNPCTTDACNGGSCQFVNNTAGCDDGNACTTADVCGGGSCAGTAISCDDGNPCTTDSCAEGAGCLFVNNTAACDDGNSCTTADVCDGGSCAGAAVSCNDNNPCTTDSCAGGTCQFVNNTLSCDDGNACTIADVCGGGSCAGTEIVCDDENICTGDSCDPATGCVFAPNVLPCDDGNICTEADACSGGACLGTALSCDDGYPKSTDSCDPLSGCTYLWPEVCDGEDNDGNGATDDVACGSGACSCGANGIATCPQDCSVCPDEDDLAIAIDDGGVKKVICAHDYPAWGVVAEAPATFTDNGNGTISDSLTGLQWQSAVDANSYVWSTAKSYCDGLTLATKQDWRLPTQFELETLVDFAKTSAPTIAAPFVAGTPSAYFWSATPYQGGSSFAWVVHFSSGYSSNIIVTYSYRVRCVR